MCGCTHRSDDNIGWRPRLDCRRRFGQFGVDPQRLSRAGMRNNELFLFCCCRHLLDVVRFLSGRATPLVTQFLGVRFNWMIVFFRLLLFRVDMNSRVMVCFLLFVFLVALSEESCVRKCRCVLSPENWIFTYKLFSTNNCNDSFEENCWTFDRRP